MLKPKNFTLYPALCSILGEEFAERELQALIDAEVSLFPEAESIMSLLPWEDAPQGWKFWSILDTHLESPDACNRMLKEAGLTLEELLGVE